MQCLINEQIFKYLDVSHFNIDKVTDMNYMFNEHSKIQMLNFNTEN